MTPYKLLAGFIYMLALMALAALYGHAQYLKGVKLTTLKYETAIAKQKDAASQKLAEVTTQVAVKEHSLQVAKDNQDIKDAQHAKIVSNLSSKLRNAINTTGGLCDSSAGRGIRSGGASGAISGNANGSTNDAAHGDGILSADFAQLLEQLTRKADDINNAYASCRADAISIRVK